MCLLISFHKNVFHSCVDLFVCCFSCLLLHVCLLIQAYVDFVLSAFANLFVCLFVCFFACVILCVFLMLIGLFCSLVRLSFQIVIVCVFVSFVYFICLFVRFFFHCSSIVCCLIGRLLVSSVLVVLSRFVDFVSFIWSVSFRFFVLF